MFEKGKNQGGREPILGNEGRVKQTPQKIRRKPESGPLSLALMIANKNYAVAGPKYESKKEDKKR